MLLEFKISPLFWKMGIWKYFMPLFGVKKEKEWFYSTTYFRIDSDLILMVNSGSMYELT